VEIYIQEFLTSAPVEGSGQLHFRPL